MLKIWNLYEFVFIEIASYFLSLKPKKKFKKKVSLFLRAFYLPQNQKLT